MKTLLTILLLLNISLSAKTINGIAITVGEEAITMKEISDLVSSEHISLDQAKETLIRKKLEKIEAENRNITVTREAVFNDISKMAEQNKMSVLELYEAVQKANNLSEKEFKKRIKEKLLTQKLYQAISYSSMSEPSEPEMLEYYNLHKDKFEKPSNITAIMYSSANKSRLSEKVNNPMFYSPDVKSQEQTFDLAKINPQLSALLIKTDENHFTDIFPSPNGGFMSFYIKSKGDVVTQTFEDSKKIISNMIMGDKRENVLKDYFERAKINADIKVIRLPKV